jgi:hypothetical protein
MGKYNVHILSLPVNIDKLRTKFTDSVVEVTPYMLSRPWEEIHYRPDICRAKSERHT